MLQVSKSARIAHNGKKALCQWRIFMSVSVKTTQRHTCNNLQQSKGNKKKQDTRREGKGKHKTCSIGSERCKSMLLHRPAATSIPAGMGSPVPFCAPAVTAAAAAGAVVVAAAGDAATAHPLDRPVSDPAAYLHLSIRGLTSQSLRSVAPQIWVYLPRPCRWLWCQWRH